ncbi:ribonuclease H-like protein [Xylariaceae sp. FL0594]|nr:ribonuclease H-like protein [Xylariaceae sp. FL0594]
MPGTDSRLPGRLLFLSREDAEAFVAGKKTSVAADSEEKFYAIAVGREPGIYTDWDEASLAIKGWKAPKYKKFATREEAVEFIRAHGNEETLTSLTKKGAEPAAKKLKKTQARREPSDGLVIQGNSPEDSETLQVFTDGSSLSNGRAGATAGVGVFFGVGDERNVSERLEGEVQTNQRAELTAIIRALESTKEVHKIRIFSDSKYSIECSTNWYRSWERNNWLRENGKEVLNQDLVKRIRSLIEERDAAGFETQFQWVKGHSNDAGNSAADLLAVAGARKR